MAQWLGGAAGNCWRCWGLNWAVGLSYIYTVFGRGIYVQLRWGSGWGRVKLYPIFEHPYIMTQAAYLLMYLKTRVDLLRWFL